MFESRRYTDGNESEYFPDNSEGWQDAKGLAIRAFRDGQNVDNLDLRRVDAGIGREVLLMRARVYKGLLEGGMNVEWEMVLLDQAVVLALNLIDGEVTEREVAKIFVEKGIRFHDLFNKIMNVEWEIEDLYEKWFLEKDASGLALRALKEDKPVLDLEFRKTDTGVQRDKMAKMAQVKAAEMRAIGGGVNEGC